MKVGALDNSAVGFTDCMLVDNKFNVSKNIAIEQMPVTLKASTAFAMVVVLKYADMNIYAIW